MTERPTPRLLVTLGILQAKHPWRFVVVAVLSILPAIWATSGIGFKPDFAELLPDNKDSVIEARRVSDHLPGASTLTLAAEVTTPDQKALEAFVDAVVPELRALGPDWVGGIDFGVKDTRDFFDDHKLLFAKLANLQKAASDIDRRYDWEVGKKTGSNLDEDDVPPEVTADSLEKTLAGPKPEKKADEPPATDSHPNGYYEHPNHKLIAVLVHTPVSGKKKTAELRRKVEDVVARVNPKRFAPSMTVGYTGDIITSAEVYDSVVTDLGKVGAAGVIGVLLSVFFFFLRVRTILTMGATLLVALLWTFGLTRFTIGYLNTSTGFLVSIIAGNGINYGIMYMARYVEARRDEHVGVADAIAIAHRDSWVPTLASAATAMLAYGSLIVTDFRGFKHFGIIGSYGMLICWTTTYLFMPAILAASERVLPSFKERPKGARETRQRGYYGVLFAKLALAYPRTLTVAGAVLGAISVVLAVLFFTGKPMEYDMTRLNNESADPTTASTLSTRVDELVGRLGQDGMAIMTDRVDQVPILERELLKKRDAAPAKEKPFSDVVTIFSLLPTDQDAKIPILKHMKEKLDNAHRRKFISDKDWADLQKQWPKGQITPIGIGDLPEQVARAFTEVDGTRGRIVYIVPADGESVWDAHYLIRWADSFRYTKLPETGEIIKGSGRAVIFADMIQTIVDDAPKAILVSALGSILVIIVAFRGKAHALGVFIPWLMGVAGLVAFLYLRGIHLNFLNFVAIPITIGIGAEYAHNLMQRYRIEGDQRVYHVVVETGGAVILCSMTTTIGYLALLISINRGIVSFGLAAAAGEVTCVVAAVLWLPAFLAWRGKLRRTRGEHFLGEGGPPSTRRKGKGSMRRLPAADGAESER